MPAQVPRTSTMALTAATLPYISKLANLGIARALNEVKELGGALNTHRGMLTNSAVAESLGMRYAPVAEALG